MSSMEKQRKRMGIGSKEVLRQEEPFRGTSMEQDSASLGLQALNPQEIK